jgi:hypothetical protein
VLIRRSYQTMSKQDIKVGDFVGTRWRGGTREGYVEEMLDDGKKAKFTNQRGKEVVHNVTTLKKDVDLSPGGTEGMTDEDLSRARKDWEEEVGHSTGQQK